MSTNPDLDPWLGAYLDGELDADGRRRVEQAARSDPALADRMTSLSRVRDLVATISHPEEAVDVSGEVVASIARKAHARRLAWRRAHLGFAAALPALAAAAALMMMAWPGKVGVPGPPLRTKLAALRVAPPALTRALTARPIRTAPAILPVERAIPATLLASETKARDDLARFEALVGRKDVRQINVVVDTLGPTTLGDFDEVIKKSSRREPEHARIRIVQNVSLDPRKPGPACVYAVVMDEVERDALYTKLRKSELKSFRESGPPEAETLASLPRIGTIEILHGEPRATLLSGPPPGAVATALALEHPERTIRRDGIMPMGGALGPFDRPPAPASPARPDRKAETPPAPRPSVREDRPAPEGRGGDGDPDPPSRAYLVWLTVRDPSQP
jgi:hypothetical protein